MSSIKRKVNFYSFSFLEFLNKENYEIWNAKLFDIILDFIISLPLSERILKDESIKKSYYLSFIERNDKVRCIQFKSCKFGHCPPIMDSDTGDERNTDKELNEGDQELTHLAVRLDDNEGFCVLESRRTGLSISKIISYINEKIMLYLKEFPHKDDKNYRIHLIYSIVPINDFDKALGDMSKLKIANIYVNKESIGSELNNLIPEEDPFIQDELILSFKAKRGENFIKRTIKNFYSAVSNTSSPVTRVRISGENLSGTSQILDSELIRKTQSIEVDLLANGIVSTKSIFGELTKLLEA